MEENNEKKLDAEELKEEAADAVNQIKDTIKNVDIKKDTLETKGFLTEMIKNPLGKIKEVATKNDSKFLKYVIIIIAIWCVAELIYESFTLNSLWGFSHIGTSILSVIISAITPILSVLIMSIIVYILNKNNRKNITTVFSAITTASIPLVVASIIRLLNLINSRIGLITSPFSKLCNIISIILSYFAIKNIFGIEKNSEFIKKFVIIQFIYYIVYIILSLLGIYV